MPPAHRRNILVLGLARGSTRCRPPLMPDAPPAASSSSAPCMAARRRPWSASTVGGVTDPSRLADMLPPLGAAFRDVRAHVAAAGAGSGGGEEVMIDRLHLGARACSNPRAQLRRPRGRADLLSPTLAAAAAEQEAAEAAAAAAASSAPPPRSRLLRERLRAANREAARLARLADAAAQEARRKRAHHDAEAAAAAGHGGGGGGGSSAGDAARGRQRCGESTRTR